MAKLILFRGAPGSGKSTLSVFVGKKIKGKTVVIPKDAVKFRFFYINIKDNKLKSQGTVSAIVEYYLSKNINVIVEGVFGGEDFQNVMNHFKKIAAKGKSKFCLINIHAELETTLFRNKKRKGKTIPEKDVKKWHKYFYLKSIKDGLHIDNNKLSKKKAVDLILKYINNC